MNNHSKTNRIAWNTTLLYFRMIVVLLVNLYAVRILFNALGIVDYGIYNVVAGIITLMSSISGVLSAATQRYYSHAIGEGDNDKLQKIFSVSLSIHVAFALLIVIVGKTLGLWFINNELVIPDDRLYAVNWIYQFSIISLVCLALQVPFSAAMIAREDMGLYSVVSIVESTLKLLAALSLIIAPLDRLIHYGAFSLFISVSILISFIYVGRSRYAECRYKRPNERVLFLELLSFSGWTLLGSVANVGMFQVNTILTNIFFGPIVNAARAISIQFIYAINSFTGSMLLAVRPQMIKSFAEGDFHYMNKVFYLSNKIIYYGLLIVCMPIIFEMEVILNLWIGDVDFDTQLFSKLILVYAIIMALNNPISIVIQATGKVKEYHIYVESFTLMVVPATYIMYNLGFEAYWTYVVMIIAAILAHVVRLVCLKKYYSHFSVDDYIKLFVYPAVLITSAVTSVIVITGSLITDPLSRVLFVTVQSVIITSILVYVFGLSKSEKIFIKESITLLRAKYQ